MTRENITIALTAIKPFKNNARTHSDEQIAQIAASIREFGFTNPILIDEENGLIAGHGRILGAAACGMTEVPAVRLTGLSSAQRRALVIADNKLALNAGWDFKLLTLELGELAAAGFNIDLTGFNKLELGKLFPLASRPDEDEIPESAPPVATLGDIWALGKHRLMCGDSLSISAVDALMAGGLADLVFSDPPYNVAYSGRGENDLGTIKNDDMSAPEFEAFCDGFYASMFAALRPLGCIYICHPDSQSAPKLAFERGFAKLFKKSSTIIWAKQSAGMGWQDYRAQHEPILYGWKPGDGKHYFCGDRAKTTVWNISRDSQTGYVHPTQKPVALPEEAILNSSKEGDIVLDLFGGSGSTLIACEKTTRSCRMMELDPKYCDTIIARWEKFTGEKAVRE